MAGEANRLGNHGTTVTLFYGCAAGSSTDILQRVIVTSFQIR